MEEEGLLAVFKAEPKRTYSLPELLKRANIPAKKEKAAKRILKNLVQRGVLERTRGRQYALSRAGQTVAGRVDFDRRLGAVLIPEGTEGARKSPAGGLGRDRDRGRGHGRGGERAGHAGAIPILEDDHARIEHNDRVRAELAAFGRKGAIFARVVAILERPSSRRTGVFRQVAMARFVEIDVVPGYLSRTTAASRRTVTDVIIAPGDDGGARDGQMVEVELFLERSHKGASPLGRVVEVLGQPGERSTEMRRLFIEHSLTVEFPPRAVEETAIFGTEPSPSDTMGRRDVRNIPLVTIDSETAKDFDDAVYAVREDRDHIRLLVAIADVSHYVRPNTALDQEAFRRGTSTYLTDRAIPMLPEALSNGLCSLKPNVDRLCMLADLVLDAQSRVVSAVFEPAVMRSKARLTYTRVARALEGEPDEECRAVLPSLLLMAQASHHLLERRLKRGAIDLDLPEPEVKFSDEGHPIDVVRRGRNDAHRLIEELMLVTNETAADFFLSRDLPSIFRVHEDPDPLKLEIFAGLCTELGFTTHLSKKPKPLEVMQVLSELVEHPMGSALNRFLLRSLNQAKYDAECKGHYGLASDRYLHFTSPIRRYPDLMVHRIMKEILRSGAPSTSHAELDAIALACSGAERRAMLAERESTDLDRTYVAAERIGEEHEARITGAQAFGLFATIDHPFIEGLIPVQALADDYYELDKYGATLVGQQTGRRYMLGDTLKVEIASANVGRRQVEFRLARTAHSSSAPTSTSASASAWASSDRPRKFTPRTRTARSTPEGRTEPRKHGARGRPRATSAKRPKKPKR
ncbi:MAG: ribonuclease R [Deltaproteobacteria bacterium]|nr:ribonuclease R [Deltaproteobacteria bacterium]